MRIHIGFEIVFECINPVPMMLMLYVHPEQAGILQQPERLVLEPAIPVHDFVDEFGNRAARLVAPAGKLRVYYDNIALTSDEPEPGIQGKLLHPVQDLPDAVLPFLLSSRYCEVDRLTPLAWELFGKTPPTWQRVQAIIDWTQKHVEFGYQYASPTATAWDIYGKKQGVCRDYMHLAISMLRAMNVPARYATGYLGDIGVPAVPDPMDFSAFLEVYLSGQWWPLDARHNERRIGRIKQGHGRDATDVALSTSFGRHKLEKFVVWTDEVK